MHARHRSQGSAPCAIVGLRAPCARNRRHVGVSVRKAPRGNVVIRDGAGDPRTHERRICWWRLVYLHALFSTYWEDLAFRNSRSADKVLLLQVSRLKMRAAPWIDGVNELHTSKSARALRAALAAHRRRGRDARSLASLGVTLP